MVVSAADLFACGVIGLASAAIAVSFTQGSMFAPLRNWIAGRNKLLGELAHCFFCFGHWIAFAGVVVYQPRPVQAWLAADLVVSAFVVVALSTLFSGLMFAAFLAAGHSHLVRERAMAARANAAGQASASPAADSGAALLHAK